MKVFELSKRRDAKIFNFVVEIKFIEKYCLLCEVNRRKSTLPWFIHENKKKIAQETRKKDDNIACKFDGLESR